ncbi:MAG: SEC-C metal-binding domain-containing protein [Syntrophomonas sp.]|nr:SEC-C metal-binding domain-containing protein [Syntrophomonas sp.]
MGRNSLCPCGSGRKYKHCCLGLQGVVKITEKPFELYSQLIGTIKIKLDKYYEADIKKQRDIFQDRFLRLCTTNYLPPEREPFFSDWLWFDLTDNEGKTFSSNYLREHGDFMEKPLLECLQSLNSSYLSIYKITGVENNGLKVKDFFTGQEEHIITKETLDTEIDSQPLLLGRLVAMPLGQVFSGMVLMLKNDDGQGDFIRKHIDYLHMLKQGMEFTSLLKHSSEILFGLFERANHKSLIRLNDIRVLPLADNAEAITTALKDCPDLIGAHETEGICWYDLRDSLGNARIGISNEFLISSTDLIDDTLFIQGFIRGVKPDRNWEIVHSLFLFQPPPPHLEHIWYSVVKDQETERWLHTSHRELDDKTPLEVMQETNGRERILAMLDSFASQAANEYSQDLLNYMVHRIK